MPTSASLFSGGKFADVGLMAAGFAPIWGVEMDPAVAEVADANLPGVTIRARVEDVDYRRLEPPDLLWASPECKEFSAAKANGAEGPAQRAQADAICAALEAQRPPLFVLENVIGYRRSEYSLPRICAALARLGYLYTLTNVNCADFAVPQTRRRLILRAARSLLPPLRGRERWVGWYAAIADLIPTLPESAFAPWQLARLEPLFGDTLVEGNSPTTREPLAKGAVEPSWTVRADASKGMPRAFLAHPTADNPRFPVRDGADPSFVIGAGGSLPSGFLLDGNSSGQEWGKLYRADDEPAFTTKIITRPNSHMPHAFIVDDQHGGQLRGEDGRGLTIRQAADPVFTVQAGSNKPARAWLEQGRVVAMTPRALARFQSIPDSYVLPEHRGLACRIIGNGVPPLLAQRVAESLLGLLP